MLKINNIPINFTDQGNGICLVFLHGFIESIEIWEDFASYFSKNYRVICIDLPGHGKSGIAKHSHTIEFMSEIVYGVLNSIKVTKCIIIGHSMGGYVALNFANKFPKKLLGFCLFHSHPFEDSEQKKKDRSLAIKIVQRNPAVLISEMIPNLFANKNTAPFQSEAEKLKKIASGISKDGFIKSVEGMIERKDSQESIKKSMVPVHVILGKKDGAMNFEDIKPQLELSPLISSLILENVGHVGFIEARNECLKSLEKFFEKCIDLEK